MSDMLEALILGVIQGLTEFLPVSSSGHLELAKYFLGDDSVGEASLLMTVSLHAATALSTLVVFRKTIVELLQGLLKFQWNEATRFVVYLLISMIPAVCIGLLFEEQIEQLFSQRIVLVACMLILTGLLLFLADQAQRTDKAVNGPRALLIGIAQAVAILPGISRSGATIATSVLLGVDREKAARFSFLMVVPLILGKIFKDLLDGAFTQHEADLPEIAVGFLAAFLTGLGACIWMIQLVKRSNLRYFSIYCFIIAGLSLAIFFLYR